MYVDYYFLTFILFFLFMKFLIVVSFLNKQMKTGGLVVWTKKDTLVIYRGHKYRLKNSDTSIMNGKICRTDEKESITPGIFMEEDMSTQPIMGSLFERETDRLLDGLGPRFVDWWMRKPLPVDADLLPEVVNGFKRPSRLCPPHSRSKLKDDELTYLRKLAHALPTHFALGIFLPTVSFICQCFHRNNCC